MPNPFENITMPAVMERAKNIGIKLKDSRVDMNQLRNFYDSVIQIGIQLKDKRRVQGVDNTEDPAIIRQVSTLPAKLVWAAAKQDNDAKREALKKFYEEVEQASKAFFGATTLNFEAYEKFQDFVEAVVIYHKARDKKVI